MAKLRAVLAVLLVAGYALAVLTSCKLATPAAPPPPKPLGVMPPPYPPTPPTFTGVKPSLPGKKQSLSEVAGDRFELRGCPVEFPVTTDDLIVVSVPAQVAAAAGNGTANSGSGMASSMEQRLRFAAILGFLTAGFRVKDAGVVETSTLTMQRYPATETEKSVRVEATTIDGENGTEQTVQRTTMTNPPSDDWWLHRGMRLTLKDPTSLWAPELLAYQKLKADYFLRIFDVDFVERGQRSVAMRYEIAASEATHFQAALQNYNTQVAAANEMIQKYNEALAAYKLEWQTYKVKYDQVKSALRSDPRQTSIQPYLGVYFEGADSGHDLTVKSVHEGFSAQTVLKSGDVILAIDNTDVHNIHQVLAVVAKCQIGGEIAIRFLRDGAEQTAAVTLGQYVGTKSELPVFAPQANLEPMETIDPMNEGALDARRQARLWENVATTFAHIRAEVVHTETGEVVWAGQFSVAGNPNTTTLDTIFTKMAEYLAKSNRQIQNPQDEQSE